jgi:hypothetical protein
MVAAKIENYFPSEMFHVSQNTGPSWAGEYRPQNLPIDHRRYSDYSTRSQRYRRQQDIIESERINSKESIKEFKFPKFIKGSESTTFIEQSVSPIIYQQCEIPKYIKSEQYNSETEFYGRLDKLHKQTNKTQFERKNWCDSLHHGKEQHFDRFEYISCR